jgi:NitT/TauT family transport system substrate-binding protein
LPRIVKAFSMCITPQHAAEERLRAEGFAGIRYVEEPLSGFVQAIGRGEADFAAAGPSFLIQAIVGGAPIVVAGGVHGGCYQLFAQNYIRRVSELGGKRVAAEGNPALFSLIAAQVGLDPGKDFDYVRSADPAVDPLDLSRKARSTPSFATRHIPRSCARGTPATSSSAPRWTGPGRNISAACCSASARCARS